jgi:ATP-binding cassette subfamily B protein
MARLYDATEGTVELNGRDIRTYSPEERSKIIGFILQEPFLFTGTVLDNVFYGHPELGGASKEDRTKALEESGLDSLLTNFENGLDTEMKTGGDSISLGQRQLIAFARALVCKPRLLFLDEWTESLDDTAARRLVSLVKRKQAEGTTVIYVSHNLGIIRDNAQHICMIVDGRLSLSVTAEEFANNGNLSKTIEKGIAL